MWEVNFGISVAKIVEKKSKREREKEERNDVIGGSREKY